MRVAAVLACVLVLQVLASPRGARPGPYEQAWQLIGQFRNEEAIQLLDDFIAQGEANHLAYALLARAYSVRREAARGERHFARLLERHPSDALAHYGLAKLLGDLEFHEGDPFRAAEEYSTCARLAPHAYFCAEHAAAMLVGPKGPLGEADIVRAAPAPPGSAAWYLARAGVRLVERRMDEAGNLLVAALALAEARDDRLLQALLHTRLGIYEIGQLPERVRHLKAARALARETHDLETELIAERELLRFEIYQGYLDEGHSALEALTARVRSFGHRIWEAYLSAEWALYYRRRADFDAEIEAILAGERAWRAVGNEGYGALVHGNLCDTYRAAGRLQEALACFEAYHAPRPAIEGFRLRGLAGVLADLGDYFGALRYETESVRVFEGEKMSWQAGAGLGNVADHHAALGAYEEAIHEATRSLAFARRHHDGSEITSNLFRLGDYSLRLDKVKEAIAYLREAMAADPGATWAAGGNADLSAAYRRSGRHPEAFEAARRSIGLARRHGLRVDEARGLRQLGYCCLESDDASAAMAAFGESLAIAERHQVTAEIAAARHGLALAHARAGRLDDAYAGLETAIDLIEGMRDRLPDAKLRGGILGDNWPAYEDMLALLERLDRERPGQGYDRKAFAYAERSRGRTVLDLLAEARQARSARLSPEQRRQQNEIRAQLSAASAALAGFDAPSTRQALAAAERRLAAFELEVKKTIPDHELPRYPAPSGVEEAQFAAGAETIAFVAYSLGEKTSLAWVVTGSRTTMVRLASRAAIEKAVGQLRPWLSRRPRRESDLARTNAAADRVYRLLLTPLRSAIGAARSLVVIPDGALHYLPFEALKPEGGSYLVERCAIAYAPSVSVYLGLRPRAAREGSRLELLAFGDPVLPPLARGIPTRAPSGPAVRGDDLTGAGLSRLPNARREVEQIAGLFPPSMRTIRTGSSATERALKTDDLRAYRRLHFATHAIVDGKMPARSGLLLSPGPGEDGFLQMDEILGFDLDADLVVLSACRTGLGQLVNGQGMVGLARTFLHAGAARVAVSLWDVDDVATAELMEAFYRAMSGRTPPALALRRARLALLHSSSPAYHHPYYWAPFVLVGS